MDYHNTIRAHRCKQSVKRNLSIRLCNPYKSLLHIDECGDTRWWLLKHKYDFDYDIHYLQPITPIEFCPCCGEKLSTDESADS